MVEIFKWQKLFNGLERTGIYMIIDDLVYNLRGRGQLHTIPFFRELGIENFTFPYIWQEIGYNLVPYNYIHINDLKEQSQFPICQIISQEIENEFGLTRVLLEVHDKVGSDNLLVLVVDTDLFKLKGAGRLLKDQLNIQDKKFYYQDLLRKYLVMEGISNCLPEGVTSNLFFLKMAHEYKKIKGTRAGCLTDLFPVDFREVRRGSLLWELLKSLTVPEVEEIGPDYIISCLRSWEERNEAGRVAERIYNLISAFGFRQENMERWVK